MENPSFWASRRPRPAPKGCALWTPTAQKTFRLASLATCRRFARQHPRPSRIAPCRHRPGADNGAPCAERSRLVTPPEQASKYGTPEGAANPQVPLRCPETTMDAPGLHGASSPLVPLRCCCCRVQSCFSPFALHCAASCGGRDKWFLLKATSTGRPQSPRFSVKGRRARNK